MTAREQLLEQLTAERYGQYCETDYVFDDCDRNVSQRRGELVAAVKGWRPSGEAP